MIGYKDNIRAQTVAESGIYEIKVHHTDPVHVPCGPLTTSGLINHKNYRLQCRYPPSGLPGAVIIEALNSKYKVVDVELENWTSPNRRNMPLNY